MICKRSRLAWKTWLTLMIRVRVIPTQPGQKEKRYVQLLFGEPELDVSAASPTPTLESVADKSRAGASGSPVATLFIVIWFDHT
jgi:uncharacterized protein YceH (UPF0502 family)